MAKKKPVTMIIITVEDKEMKWEVEGCEARQPLFPKILEKLSSKFPEESERMLKILSQTSRSKSIETRITWRFFLRIIKKSAKTEK